MSAPLRIPKFKTNEEREAFLEHLARAALMAYFDPNPSPVKAGLSKQGGVGSRERWSQFEDMKQNGQRGRAVRAVEAVLQSETHGEDPSSSGGAGGPSGSPGGGPTGSPGSPEFAPSPGWWQPEVKIHGGEWSTKLPEGRSAPHIRKGRVFALPDVDDKSGNLPPFRIFYVDDKHAGMGPIYSSHGVWSLDFFTPNGEGIVVNDDEPDPDDEFDNPPLSVGGRYMLRFRKIPEPSKPGR